jgi:hypothetical protein
MPCQRLAVKDAAGAAKRSKILDGEWHGDTLSRATWPHTPRVLRSANGTPQSRTLRPASQSSPGQPQLTHRALSRCRSPSRPREQAKPSHLAGPSVSAHYRGRHMAIATRDHRESRNRGARGLCAPRGGRARSAVGRRSSSPAAPSPAAPATALSRYRRKVSNHPLVACDDPTGWRRGARMNLRAMAAADPDTPERQRNCGAVPIGSQVEIRIKDGSAYYCGVETCGNV